MNANNFTEKLKATGSETDLCDLKKVHQEYKDIVSKLPSADRGTFSVNVLCVLSRNLEKISTWKDRIDFKSLVILCIDCIRETRCLEGQNKVRALACIHYLHNTVIKQPKQIPCELVLKLSYMPFENDVQNLLPECSKTYWALLFDRLMYFEKLNTNKVAIVKLLPKLLEDIVKAIKITESVKLCSNVLIYLVKQLHYVFNERYPKELNEAYGVIFENISLKTDLTSLQKLSNSESLLDLYGNLNDCLYVIAENSSKINFKSDVFTSAVQTCVIIFRHCKDIEHCLQTIYLGYFCHMFTEKWNTKFIETILFSLIENCEAADKLGYAKAMIITYPYINQCLRLYISHCLTNCDEIWRKPFMEQILISCCKIVLFSMKRMRYCKQMVKCENCPVKTAFHDVLRLSFLVKNMISTSLDLHLDITNILPTFLKVIVEQYKILTELKKIGCKSYEKLFRKQQTDVHNTAVLLNKASYYEYALKLFDLYLKYEIGQLHQQTDFKNISRGMFNKSMSLLDLKRYEEALLDAYLSLIFSLPDGLESDKHMSLVFDIKSKMLRSDDSQTNNSHLPDDESKDDLQLMTTLDACKKSMEEGRYGNLKPFFCDLKFSDVLRHEFSMYVKLWPSIVPIAGVWRSLHYLVRNNVDWIKVEKDMQLVLYGVILETPMAVRSLNSVYYDEVLSELETDPPSVTAPAQRRVIYATMLLMKCELDLVEAAKKHEWKAKEPMLDPDQYQATRTVPQEHAAVRRALLAVRILTDVHNHLTEVPHTTLQNALATMQVFVQQLMFHHRLVEALQLAHICCDAAALVDNKESYLLNAGTILCHASTPAEELDGMISTATNFFTDLVDQKDTLESAVIFICNLATYHYNCGNTGLSASLVRIAQAIIIDAEEKYKDIHLELGTGRLMECQRLVCLAHPAAPSSLTAVNLTQRHYLQAVNNTGTSWSSRCLRGLLKKIAISRSTLEVVHVSRALALWRRARAAVGACLASSAALTQAMMVVSLTNVHSMEDAQTKIDNRLRYILGEPSHDAIQINHVSETKAPLHFTPKQDLETMLEQVTFKKTQMSPSVPILAVPGFKLTDAVKHDSTCQCHTCQIPHCLTLICQTSGLEAAMYYRAKENDIARNYFEGAMKSFALFERKLEDFGRHFKGIFEGYIVDIVLGVVKTQFRRVQLEILIEAALFDLSQLNFKDADDKIVWVKEILQESKPDAYLNNEVYNLIITAARLKLYRNISRHETNLEEEFDNLKLSPNEQLQKTPELKPPNPPKITKVVVNDDEIPAVKRRGQKLNFEECDDSAKAIPESKRSFKIPVPVTSKQSLETTTPRPSRKAKEIPKLHVHKKIESFSEAGTSKEISVPKLLVTQPSLDGDSISDFKTPKHADTTKTTFFTPQDTPSEYFTPMTSIKTYTKRTLSQKVAKNLEAEFSKQTVNKENLNSDVSSAENDKPADVDSSEPVDSSSVKCDMSKRRLDRGAKAKVETGSFRSLREKRSFKRATSPGKLDKELKEKPARKTRLPIRFSIDDGKE